MATPTIALTLMENSVLPSKLHEILLNTSQSTARIVLFQDNSGQVQWRRESDTDDISQQALARIHALNHSCVLETFVNHVFVEPPVAEVRNTTAGISLLPSDEHIKRYIYLRSGDVVDFSRQNFKISVAIGATSGQAAEAAPATENFTPEVQVMSSHTEEQPPEHVPADDDATDSEPDDSLDRVQTPRTKVTPARPRPSEPTIKETPSHSDTMNGAAEDEQLYSTAQDRQSDDDGDQVRGQEPESPSLRAQKPKGGESQGLTTDRLVASFDTSEPASEEVVLAPRHVNVTYGKQRSRNSSKTASRSHDLSVRDSPDSEHLDQSQNDKSRQRSSQTEQAYDHMHAEMLPTSDPMDEHDYSVEVVARSMRKRKSPDGTAEEADEISNEATSQKKARIQGSDDDHTSDAKDEAKSPKTKGHRRQHRETHPQLATEESSEIVVSSTRRSPKVVVKTRQQTNSPDSSAQSPPIDQVSKVLLSSDSKFSKSKTLGNWLEGNGVRIIDKVPSAKRTTFVCVVPEKHSLKSVKVLHSLVLNKPVVTDAWLEASKDANALLDPIDYVHSTLEQTATHDRSRLFAGKRLFFTPTAVKNYGNGWKDICDVAKAAEAIAVDKVALSKASQLKLRDAVGLFFGADAADEDVARLVTDFGHTVYSKDLFTHMIISGESVPSEEFAVTPTKTSGKRRRS